MKNKYAQRVGIDVDDKKNLDALSKRQREVWELLEQGQSRKQIAEKLGISYNAVTLGTL